LLGEALAGFVGQPITQWFEAEATEPIHMLLASVRASGRADEISARLASEGRAVVIWASLFRQGNSSLFIVRLHGADSPAVTREEEGRAELLDLLQAAPDAIVLTDLQGRILSANPAFLELAQLGTEEQALGQSIDRWLGRQGVDLNVLVANLRQHGSVRLFATTLRSEYGAVSEIEVSAACVWHGEQARVGFIIRNVGRRLVTETRATRELPRTVENLTELVGRVPLKDLVRETTDVIERLCIETALELTGDSRASAAEILGLSRQSLYVKLRRYGLGDLGSDEEP
jgi:transcriptional regulator PpsR